MDTRTTESGRAPSRVYTSCLASAIGTPGFSSVPTEMVMSIPSSLSSILTSCTQASSLILGPWSMPSTVRTVSASSTMEPGRPLRSESTWTSSGAGPSAATTSSTTPALARGEGFSTTGPGSDSERAKALTARPASPEAMSRASV